MYIFRKTIDFSKSSGSYLVDSKSGNEYLDFFGQYSTLAIGYNHPIFKTSYYLDEIKRIAHQKITNCEILSEESDEFNSIFKNYTSKGNFSHYHYCCTGALAIEAAVKTAMDYKGKGYERIITFKKSFHGINGIGTGMRKGCVCTTQNIQSIHNLCWFFQNLLRRFVGSTNY